MSASREKKIRQELAAQGIPDIKEIRAAEEKKQQRRANWLYGTIAILFAVTAAALLLWNSQVIQRSSTAISVDGEKFSAAEVEYYYYSSLNSTKGSTYASYMSLDTSLPLTQQTLLESDYMLLGLTPEEGVEMTWHDYFINKAKTSLVQLAALLKNAKADNFAFTDEMQAQADASMGLINAYAAQSGMTTAAYIKAMFGDTMTTKVLEKIIHETTLATFYEQSRMDALTYSDAEIETYYNENKNAFDLVDCDDIYFKGSAPSTTDADGNTVYPTEEEQAAAKEAAKEAADDALARYNAGETDMEALAKRYSMATFYSMDNATDSGTTLNNWLFDAEREAGDVAVLETGSTYYLARFNSRSRQEYNTVDVRHILVELDTTGLDSTAADYQTKLDALKADAKAEAERILNEWKSGAATAESFGELANKESDDEGSNTKGGLYTQVPKGKMVAPFDEWCFDAARQEGDTGIVYAESLNYTGYHVIYFQSTNDVYWKIQVSDTMAKTDYSEWLLSEADALEAKELRGMKYVG